MNKKKIEKLGNQLGELLFEAFTESPAFKKYIKSMQVPNLAARKVKPTKNTRVGALELRQDILTRLRVLPRGEGMSVGKIANVTHSSLEAARYALKLLRRAGKVRMTGKRATAKWLVRR